MSFLGTIGYRRMLPKYEAPLHSLLYWILSISSEVSFYDSTRVGFELVAFQKHRNSPFMPFFDPSHTLVTTLRGRTVHRSMWSLLAGLSLSSGRPPPAAPHSHPLPHSLLHISPTVVQQEKPHPRNKSRHVQAAFHLPSLPLPPSLRGSRLVVVGEMFGTPAELHAAVAQTFTADNRSLTTSRRDDNIRIWAPLRTHSRKTELSHSPKPRDV